jgi:hypothetical protein
MDWAVPDNADPIKKMTIAIWKTVLRPYWSPSLPYKGVDTVLVNRYAVTTHDSELNPPRSPTMVGSAVDTIVWSRLANTIANISPVKINQIGRAGRDTAGRSSTVATLIVGASNLWPDHSSERAEVERTDVA